MASNMDIEFREPNIARFEILSFSHGYAPPSGRSTSGGGRGEQEMTFSKYGDQHTQSLLRACLEGKVFRSAILAIYRESVKAMTVVMKNVTISNFSVSGGAGDMPVESISLTCGSLEYEYGHSKETSSEPHDPKRELPG